jgi:hypothetical protein
MKETVFSFLFSMGVLTCSRIGVPNEGCMTANVLRTFASRVVQRFSDAYPGNARMRFGGIYIALQ